MKNVPAGISESFARLRFSFPVAGFLVAGCGQIRGRKSLKTTYPKFSFPVAGFFGGRLLPDKGTQVPENSLKQFRKPKPQILISCGWIFWWPAAAR